MKPSNLRLWTLCTALAATGCVDRSDDAASDEMTPMAGAGGGGPMEGPGERPGEGPGEGPGETPIEEPAPFCGAQDDTLQSMALRPVSGQVIVRRDTSSGVEPWAAGVELVLTHRLTGFTTRFELDEEGRFEGEAHPAQYTVTLENVERVTGALPSKPLSTTWTVAEDDAEPLSWHLGLEPIDTYLTFAGEPLGRQSRCGIEVGTLTFTHTLKARAWTIPVTDFSEGEVHVWLPAGEYAATWSGLPSRGLPEGTQDLGIHSLGERRPLTLSLGDTFVNTTGLLMLDNQALPEWEIDNLDLPRGHLVFRSLDHDGYTHEVPLTSSGEGDFSTLLLPGHYEILATSLFHHAPSSDVVEDYRYETWSLCPAEGCDLSADGFLSFDLANAVRFEPEPEPEWQYPNAGAYYRFGGQLNLMGDWPPAGIELPPAVGYIRFTHHDDTLRSEDRHHEFPVASNGSFGGTMPAGHYTVELRDCRYNDCTDASPRGELVLSEDFEFGANTAPTFDATIVDLEISVTVNGEEMADDTLLGDGDAEQRMESRGQLSVAGFMVDFGEEGPVRARQRVFAGTYAPTVSTVDTLWSRSDIMQLSRQDALPHAWYTLPEVEVVHGEPLEIDLQVHEITVSEALIDAESIWGDPDLGQLFVFLRGTADDQYVWSAGQLTDDGFTFKAFPGSYWVELVNVGPTNDRGYHTHALPRFDHNWWSWNGNSVFLNPICIGEAQ
ncbi:MAG: hypothetical protein ACE366_31160 [Bradymonadia bacterium]